MSELVYLSRDQVAALSPEIPQLIALLEQVFREKAAGRAEMPPKIGIHPEKDAFLHAMPAFLPALRAAGTKWVSAFPENRGRGLPTIAGLIVLNDPETGLPLAVMDAGWITAKRTAAASALAARHLARLDSRILGILGCGVQGQSHLEALLALFPIREVRAYDTDEEAGERFAAEAEARFRVLAARVNDPRKAVSGCDLVTGAKPGRESPEERTMACNLGLALEDVALAGHIYREALERKIGTWLPR